jgi:hypothetical protein
MTPQNLQMHYGANVIDSIYGAGTIMYGDSFTFSSTLGRLSTILGSILYGPQTNHGVQGQQSRDCSLVTMVKPINRTQIMTILIGLNDLLRRGIAAKNGIVCNIKSMIAVSLLETNAPASALTSTGTWGDGNTILGGRARSIGGTPRFTTQGPNDAYLEWAFDGDNVVVGTITTYASSAPYKDVAVYVDGVRQSDITNYVQTSDQYGHNVGVYTGLGEGPHTLRVAPVSAGATTMIDYVGTMKDPSACLPIIVGHIPRVHSSYIYPVNGNPLPNWVVDEVNDAIDLMLDNFVDWPVRAARTNDYYTAQTECNTDLIHPSHILTSPSGPGMQHIAEAFLEHFTY